MLATFVKLAYSENYTTAEVTSSQFIYGIIGVFILHLLQVNKQKGSIEKTSKTAIFQLMFAGTSLGLTSVFYYLAVKYIPVSVGIVLLMQTVWMGVLVEWFLEKKAPPIQKISAVIVVLIGTFLAINIFEIDLNNTEINWGKGLLWGLLAAASFTTTMFTANRIAVNSTATIRSLYMLLGGGIIVLIFSISTQNTPFNFEIFTKWGIVLALFGTIIPPMLLNAGFPNTGIGLGSIVASLELPVSVVMAAVFLNEKIVFLQWIGIFCILFAILIMNYSMTKK